MISTALFASSNAFAPRVSNVASSAGVSRAFSRATSVLMANPKGTYVRQGTQT